MLWNPRSSNGTVGDQATIATYRRRQVLPALALGPIFLPVNGSAQGGKVYRIGWVSLANSDSAPPFLDAFRQGMKDRGYLEGRNVVIETRLADGSLQRADQMVAALVESKVDVIVAQGGAMLSAYHHGKETPVVMGYSGDPVEARFVESLARPGGPRTGLTFLALEMVGKRMELLAQLLPPAALVGVVADPAHPGEQTELQHSRVAAQRLGLKLKYLPVRNPQDLEASFTTMLSSGTQAVMAFPDAVTLSQRAKLAAFGIQHRLPMVSGWSAYADSGFLMTYGPNLKDSYAHLATYVDKILKGTKPADLPVELPTSVEFVINARTAKAISVKIPNAMLLRAQTIIE